MSILSSLFIGKLADVFVDLAKKKFDRDISVEEVRGEVLKGVTDVLGKMPEAQAKVLLAEAGGNWLQRSWRPLTGLSLAFTIFFWAIIVPIAVGWLGTPPLSVGDKLLEWVFDGLITFGSIYAGGRSLEKITDLITSRRK